MYGLIALIDHFWRVAVWRNDTNWRFAYIMNGVHLDGWSQLQIPPVCSFILSYMYAHAYTSYTYTFSPFHKLGSFDQLYSTGIRRPATTHIGTETPSRRQSYSQRKQSNWLNTLRNWIRDPKDIGKEPRSPILPQNPGYLFSILSSPSSLLITIEQANSPRKPFGEEGISRVDQ